MKANLCPILPYGCQPLMSNRIILFERVLNSFVQPTHSGVPPLLSFIGLGDEACENERELETVTKMVYDARYGPFFFVCFCERMIFF